MQDKSSNKKSKSFMTFLDFFAPSIDFWFNGRSKSSTTIGFLLTLGMLALLAAVLQSSGAQLFRRQKPKVVSNLVTIDPIVDGSEYDTARYNITSPIIKLDFIKTISNLPSYASLYVTKNIINDRKEVLQSTVMNLRTCKSSVDSIKSYYDNLVLETFHMNSSLLQTYLDGPTLCFSDLEIEMSRNITYQITLAPCQANCASKEDFNLLLNQESTFSLLFAEKFTNTANFSEPSPFNFVEVKSQVSLDLKRRIAVNYKGVNLQSDIGFIMQAYNYDYYINMLSVTDSITGVRKESDTNSLNSSFLVVELQMTNKIELISRNFMKAQELAALVGGILNVYILIASTISYFFASNFQMLAMINSLLKFTENESSVSSKIKQLKKQCTQGLRKSTLLVNINSSYLGKSSEGPLKAIENNYIKPNVQERTLEDQNEIENYEKGTILNKISLVTATKLAKNHLMTTDYKYSSFKFILMNFFPCCRTVRDERRNYKYLSSLIKQRLDMKEVFHQMINFKRFKYYFCSAEQQLLLNLDSKLTFEPDANDLIGNTTRK